MTLAAQHQPVGMLCLQLLHGTAVGLGVVHDHAQQLARGTFCELLCQVVVQADDPRDVLGHTPGWHHLHGTLQAAAVQRSLRSIDP